MKGKLLTIIVNFFLCAVVACVCVVGFTGNAAASVTSDMEGVYYRAEGGSGVSLMFNVYQHTENVYKILDVLDESGAKATFFLGGSWADDNVDCVREIFKRGHEVGSHGYFHKDHSKLSFDENLAEIRTSVKLITAILNSPVRLFAPPSGAYSNATVTAASSLNLKTVMWSRDTVDWRDKEASKIIKRATQNLEAGEFILMHPEDVTVASLPQILNYISENGLKTVTVSQNIGE